MSADRERLIDLARRLMSGTFDTEAEVSACVAEFQAGLIRPGASDLIFYSHKHVDHEPTAEEVVDRALSYRPIAL